MSDVLCCRRLPKLSYAQQKFAAQLGAGTSGTLGAGSATFAAVTSRSNLSYPKLHPPITESVYARRLPLAS